MKILQIIASMDPTSGGPCQGIRNAIPALRELSVDNEVVCMDDPNADYIGKDTFPIYALGPAHNPWAYAPLLKSWLKENVDRFDVVIVNGLWLYPGYAVNQAFKQVKGKRLKLFVMPHGMLDPYFQEAKSRKMKALRNWFYWKLVEKKLIHRADGILFTCEEELILARLTFQPYQPKKELNIGYGISEPPSYTAEMSLKFLDIIPEARDKNYLLYLSRIHEKKGVNLLVKAYIQLKELDLQNELPLLVIAGPGMNTDYGRNLQQLIPENPVIKKSILFPGMLTGTAKWGAFYGCEAFLLPSHQENFGIAVVEALACGKPVLISKKVNIWREIVSGGGGIVAEDTFHGTRDLLQTWIRFSEEKKTSFGKNAIEVYENKFSMDSSAKQLLSAIIQSF